MAPPPTGTVEDGKKLYVGMVPVAPPVPGAVEETTGEAFVAAGDPVTVAMDVVAISVTACELVRSALAVGCELPVAFGLEPPPR